jgi:hypothetical protein
MRYSTVFESLGCEVMSASDRDPCPLSTSRRPLSGILVPRRRRGEMASLPLPARSGPMQGLELLLCGVTADTLVDLGTVGIVQQLHGGDQVLDTAQCLRLLEAHLAETTSKTGDFFSDLEGRRYSLQTAALHAAPIHHYCTLAKTTASLAGMLVCLSALTQTSGVISTPICFAGLGWTNKVYCCDISRLDTTQMLLGGAN